MTNTSNPPYRWPGHGTILSMWDQVKQFCKRLEISSQVRAMLSPGAGEKNFRRHEELTILVILHYLLKNNIEDFNTRCCKKGLSEPLRFLPSMLGGVSGKREDRR